MRKSPRNIINSKAALKCTVKEYEYGKEMYRKHPHRDEFCSVEDVIRLKRSLDQAAKGKIHQVLLNKTKTVCYNYRLYPNITNNTITILLASYTENTYRKESIKYGRTAEQIRKSQKNVSSTTITPKKEIHEIDHSKLLIMLYSHIPFVLTDINLDKESELLDFIKAHRMRYIKLSCTWKDMRIQGYKAMKANKNVLYLIAFAEQAVYEENELQTVIPVVTEMINTEAYKQLFHAALPFGSQRQT